MKTKVWQNLKKNHHNTSCLQTKRDIQHHKNWGSRGSFSKKHNNSIRIPSLIAIANSGLSHKVSQWVSICWQLATGWVLPTAEQPLNHWPFYELLCTLVASLSWAHISLEIKTDENKWCNGPDLWHSLCSCDFSIRLQMELSDSIYQQESGVWYRNGTRLSNLRCCGIVIVMKLVIRALFWHSS